MCFMQEKVSFLYFNHFLIIETYSVSSSSFYYYYKVQVSVTLCFHDIFLMLLNGYMITF